jgi:hypothetical protein
MKTGDSPRNKSVTRSAATRPHIGVSPPYESVKR